MTGEVRFDQYGLRTGFNLDVMELKKYGLTKVSLYLRIFFRNNEYSLWSYAKTNFLL